MPASCELVVFLIDFASSTRTKGLILVLVDEKFSAFAERLPGLFLDRILDVLTGLLEVAHHLVHLAVFFELVVARNSPGSLIDFSLHNLSCVLRLIFLDIFSSLSPFSR